MNILLTEGAFNLHNYGDHVYNYTFIGDETRNRKYLIIDCHWVRGAYSPIATVPEVHMFLYIFIYNGTYT